MSHIVKSLLIAFLLYCHFPTYATLPLKVGVMHEATPIANLNEEEDTGFGLALFREAALINHWDYTLHDANEGISTAIGALVDKKYDILVGPISHAVSKDLALSNTFFTDSLSVAFLKNQYGLWRLYKTRFNHPMLIISLFTFIAFFILVHLFMLAEWRKKHEQFTSYGKALYNTTFSFYMAMTSISMSLLPKTGWGKLVMILWIIVSLLFMHGVIGVLTSTITLSDIHTAPFDTSDLKGKKIGIYNRFLPQKSIDFLSEKYQFEPLDIGRMQEAIALLEEEKIEGVIANTSLIDTFLTKEGLYKDIVTSELKLGTLTYSFLMRKDDPHLEALNRVILKLQSSKVAQNICRNYLIYPEAHRCSL